MCGSCAISFPDLKSIRDKGFDPRLRLGSLISACLWHFPNSTSSFGSLLDYLNRKNRKKEPRRQPMFLKSRPLASESYKARQFEWRLFLP